MDEYDLDKLYFDLEEIEAVLALFSNLDDNISVKYISLVAIDYYSKVLSIKDEIKKHL